MECRVFFDALPVDRPDVKNRAALIDGKFADGHCEAQSVSSSSPGVVRDDEFMHRFVFSPVHMDGDRVKTAFFSDCQYGGLSCQRSTEQVANYRIHERGQMMVTMYNEASNDPGDSRSYLGVVSANCGDVRHLRPRAGVADQAGVWDQAMMAVYDTAKAGDEEHIDVFQLAVGRRKSDLKQARRDLALVFTDTPSQN
ncbi:hypothetical protein [Pseudomonas syringae]|uniref:hypothetical protein n=1 Tax=Pseudomonas syringae TaxID=317 RepID=UPI000EFDEFCA|nr:hypothetical protein [Pseudomonas syringae]